MKLLLESATSPELPRLVGNLLGVKTSSEEIGNAAMQTYIIARMIDNKNGFDASEDTLPDRAFRRSTTPELLRETRSLLYDKVGLDQEGRVTEETLNRYGLEEYAGYL